MASEKQFIIERILRDRVGIWNQIIDERDLPKLILRMLLSSAISLAAYGAVLGASSGWLQALVSTVKLPLLFLATLAICLPTLYLFNLIFGARLSVLQTCALIMVAITVTAVLTFAFAPISLFFLITARSYEFFKLLNVAILALTALVGLRFLISGMRGSTSMSLWSRCSPARSPCRRSCRSGNWSQRRSVAPPTPRPNRTPTATRTRTICPSRQKVALRRRRCSPRLAIGRPACCCSTSGFCSSVSLGRSSPGHCARS